MTDREKVLEVAVHNALVMLKKAEAANRRGEKWDSWLEDNVAYWIYEQHARAEKEREKRLAEEARLRQSAFFA